LISHFNFSVAQDVLVPSLRDKAEKLEARAAELEQSLKVGWALVRALCFVLLYVNRDHVRLHPFRRTDGVARRSKIFGRKEAA
jgi:hypothetical protein